MKVYETHSSLVIFILITVVSGSSFMAPPPVFAAEKGLYVPNYESDTVSIIKTNTNTVSSPIIVGNGPLAIAFDPPHNRMYVTNYNSFTTGTISVIDTNTNTVVSPPIAVGSFPFAIAFDPTHNGMYVANLYSDTVSVIDSNARDIIGSPIAVGDAPFGVAFDPTHNKMYVANWASDTISVIDTNTNTLVGLPLVTGCFPDRICFCTATTLTNFLSLIIVPGDMITFFWLQENLANL